MTNGDRIRQMSNEELAKWLDEKIGVDVVCDICANSFCDGYCKEGIKAYLESEEEECI
jgi:hypothetical protein